MEFTKIVPLRKSQLKDVSKILELNLFAPLVSISNNEVAEVIYDPQKNSFS